jgi:hypothetical protein
VSNVWQTRYRLLLEQLEELADQLSGEEPITQPVLEDQTVRLLAGVLMLLRQHQLNGQGQCKYCGWRWRLWHGHPLCTVYRSVDFAMRQPLDVVLKRLRED